MRPIGIALALALLGPTLAFSQPISVLAYETKPFFYLDGEEPTGLEYEILEYFARTTGRPLEIEWADDFDKILTRLADGEADVAAATITITPEREELVDFSASYFPVRVMLVELTGQASQSLDDLAGSTLATIRGTTYEELLSAVPNPSFVYVETEREQFELLAAGTVRAFAADSAFAFAILSDFPGASLTFSLSEEQHYGFAVASGSPLAAQLSEHIGQLKRSRIYFRLLEKYLGEEAVRVVLSGRESP